MQGVVKFHQTCVDLSSAAHEDSQSLSADLKLGFESCGGHGILGRSESVRSNSSNETLLDRYIEAVREAFVGNACFVHSSRSSKRKPRC